MTQALLIVDIQNDYFPGGATPLFEPEAAADKARILLQSFRRQGLDVIHVQHFLHWPLTVIDRAVDYGVPVVVSFHDFYAVTPLFTMQGAEDPEQTFTAAWSRSGRRPCFRM